MGSFFSIILQNNIFTFNIVTQMEEDNPRDVLCVWAQGYILVKNNFKISHSNTGGQETTR